MLQASEIVRVGVLRYGPEGRIAAGVPVEEALAAFRDSVNRPGTIFSTDHWLLPKLQRLRELLNDLITADQAKALLDVLYQRRWMRDLIGWLEDPLRDCAQRTRMHDLADGLVRFGQNHVRQQPG